jgi:deoxyribose-phosphate aldolase
MTISQLAAYVDHTLFTAAAKREDIDRLCREALEYKTRPYASPLLYPQATGLLEGRIPVCTDVGFPHGAASTAAKPLKQKTP